MQKREESEDSFRYEFDDWRENLWVIFGSKWIVEIIIPTDKQVPLSGLEWTFANYDQDKGTECEKLL